MKNILILMVLSFLSNVSSSQNKVNITMENVKEICKDEPLEKRVRITVARFNVATSGASSELGENMSTMLTNALQDVNCFRVLESLKHKEDMTGEIDWGSSEYSSGNAAPQKGKMVGAQVVVTGEITEFTQQDKSVNVSFISSSKKIVKLGFIVKMVNPETRDVLFSKSFNVQGRTGGSVNASLLRGLVNFGGGSGNNPAIANALEQGVILASEFLATQKSKIELPEVDPNKVAGMNMNQTIISVNNTDYQGGKALSELIKTLNGVANTQYKFDENLASIIVNHKGSSEELLDNLLSKKGNEYKVTGSSNGKISLVRN